MDSYTILSETWFDELFCFIMLVWALVVLKVLYFD